MRLLKNKENYLRLLICLLLAGAVCLAYVQVKDHDFITFDDDMYVVNNPMVRSGLTWRGVEWAFTSMHSSNWHPLTWLSHMVDSSLYGLRPGGHHLTNVALHLANTILLFLFWVRVTHALWPSALVAILFALHPLHVESVAWVAERKDVLSTFFWLATMWAYAWYAEVPSWGRYLLVMLTFVLGLMTKPMLVTLPLVLLLLDYWPLGRVAESAGRSGPRSLLRANRRLIWEKIPLLVLTAVSCLVTLVAQKSSGAVQSLAHLPLGARVANALVGYVNYLVKMFWPYPMSFFYSLAPVPWWQAAGAGLILVLLSVALLYGSRRHPYLGVGWLWYLGTLVPVIGLVQVGGQAMADRYTYIPLIGLFLIFAWGIFELTAKWRYQMVVLAAGAAAIALACLLSTRVQTGYWRNSESLFTHALQVTGDNYMAYHHLGMALANEGKLDAAIAMYQKTLTLARAYPPAYNNLAIAYARQGRFNEAVALFKVAIRLTPNDASFYRNLAMVYRQQGEIAAAEAVMAHVRWLTGKQ